jgi:hypothetical protein
MKSNTHAALTVSFRYGTAAALLFGAVFAFAGSSVTGCGGSSDEYRCDATGCFQCDGFGCRPIPAPTPEPCSYAGDSACKTGEVCTSYGCLGTCKADGDCAKGLVCKAGLCTPPAAPPTTPLECGSAKDCDKLGDGSLCVDGKCVAAPACTDASCTCKYSSDCGAGRVCVDGACKTGCDDAHACPSGFSCDDKGYCVESSTPTCGKDAAGATCKSGEACVDGRCTASCTSDASCVGKDGKPDPTLRCVAGACIPDPSTDPTCNGDTACGSGQKCVGGFCKYTCTDDTTCMGIDNRIPKCSPTEKVCRSEADVAAKCTSKADCLPLGESKSCVDGQCK